MAKLKDNDLELEVKFLHCEDMGGWFDYVFKVTMFWKGIPVLNEKALKRYSSYWKQGAEGGIICSDTCHDKNEFTLIDDLEASIKDKKARVWEAFSYMELAVAIYPERAFPYLYDENKPYYTLIISADGYQFKDSADCYGYQGVSFIMVPKTSALTKFVEDLKEEFNKLEPEIIEYN